LILLSRDITGQQATRSAYPTGYTQRLKLSLLIIGR